MYISMSFTLWFPKDLAPSNPIAIGSPPVGETLTSNASSVLPKEYFLSIAFLTLASRRPDSFSPYLQQFHPIAKRIHKSKAFAARNWRFFYYFHTVGF